VLRIAFQLNDIAMRKLFAALTKLTFADHQVWAVISIRRFSCARFYRAGVDARFTNEFVNLDRDHAGCANEVTALPPAGDGFRGGQASA
jgi:hypothetical protein